MKQGFEKRFKNGDIVYWCHSEGNGRYKVKSGMVDEQFSDAVVIDYLVPRERRLVNGIPIDEFESQTKYKKLPKGWTYNTSLFEITYSDLTEEETLYKFCIEKPETIKQAYELGYLVKDCTVFHGVIEEEITKEGYRIVKNHPMWRHHIDHVSIRPDKVYFTYEEAKNEVDKNVKEFERQLSLTDYEWSVEHICKNLDIFKAIHGLPERDIDSYREFILGMDNVENIKTRIYQGQIQWKYEDNKRWNYIEILGE